MNYIDPEGEQLITQLLFIMFFPVILRIVLGVFAILGIFDLFDKRKK